MARERVTPISKRKVTFNLPAQLAKPQMIPSSWYLGGRHDVKLLTSVDGDLDPALLGKLTSVPKDVGEIALSVESLVSHDFIVGDFESDLLAKITTNLHLPSATTTPIPNGATQTQISTPITEAPPQITRSPSIEESFSVPNPFANDPNYKPVPNPLADTMISTPDSSPTVTISPSASPVSVTSVPIPVTIRSELFRKRKTPAFPDVARESKKAASREVQMPLVASSA